MFITVGDNAHELSTKLGTAVLIEKQFKLPLTQVLGKLGAAEITELVTIISLAAGKRSDKDFEAALLENWDYLDLMKAVEELLVNLMFTGAPDQIEAKMNRLNTDETQKNSWREMLGLPTVEIPTAPSTGTD